MHVRERLKRLMLEEGPLTAVAVARKLGVRSEEVRYYLKAPEYRIVRYEEGGRADVVCERRLGGRRGRVTLIPVWGVVVGLCDCGAPAWFEMRVRAAMIGRSGERDEMMCSVLLCHECAKANASKMGVRLAPRWPVAEG